jgi:LmbE family N-acetylglucosaminyl deacetylase
MSKSVLIVAAHTDDEALGCGGTIARHVAEGDVVHAIFMADGVNSRSEAAQDDLENRNAAAEHAREILGISENVYLGLPDNRLDSLPLIEIIQRLEPIVRKLQPNIIYTHHHGDLNVDHQITHQAVLTACRPMPGSTVQAIYAFEVMSSTEWAAPTAQPFIPNHYVDISTQLNTKLDALKAYQLEMRDAPHSRSTEHLSTLARHRGYSVGMVAAEAFMTIRTLSR